MPQWLYIMIIDLFSESKNHLIKIDTRKRKIP